jgi:hypothetical protein
MKKNKRYEKKFFKSGFRIIVSLCLNKPKFSALRAATNQQKVQKCMIDKFSQSAENIQKYY